MDDQINFTLERIPKETREVTFSDGSVLKITAPAYMLEEMDTEEETDVTSGDETSNTTVLPPAIAESPINTNTSVSNSEQPTIEMLTAEIKMYLHIANQSIIEVGKRLILAKELVPHGDWANWLKHNFNLTIRSAQRFIAVADRFSNATSMSHFDISTFKPTQLIALLALPKGQEKTFIETMAAEGTPIADMPVKKLRAEIKKFSPDSANNDSVSTQSATSQVAVSDIERDTQETSTFISPTSSPQQADITTYSSTPAYDVDKSLAQLFAVSSSLLNADNLQSVVSDAADFDFSSFKQQLSQLAALQAELQKYLNVWEDSHINKSPIDRDVIIAELKHMALLDLKNLTSSLLLALVKSFGFDDMSHVPDELLPDILRKMKAFQAFLPNM